ncbi:hypothetical protein C6P45_000569 [Maudiozyma exigua]|uniref:PA14 domain-containing protein n=1 Tax=Maudiozyma exigua TaxID=34358 RepID=A0A9P7B7P1_MAUEX|nr:hypothetical protein C6P45_000569 [Kazachstania exigua]
MFLCNRSNTLLIVVLQLFALCRAQRCYSFLTTISDPIDGFETYTSEYIPQGEDMTVHEYFRTLFLQNSADINLGYQTNPNFEISVSSDNSDGKGTLYGKEVPISNLVVNFYGYFMPKVTGYYTFELSTNDMAAMLLSYWDMYCCNVTVPATEAEYFDLYYGLMDKYTNYLEISGSGNQTQQMKVYLTAGRYINLIAIAINREGDPIFNMTITDPYGETFSDLDGYIFYNTTDQTCNGEITLTETASVLSTTTYSSTTSTTTAVLMRVPEYITTYYIKVPLLSSSSSSTIASSYTSIPSQSSAPSSSAVRTDQLPTEASSVSSSMISSSASVMPSENASFSELSSSVVASSTVPDSSYLSDVFTSLLYSGSSSSFITKTQSNSKSETDVVLSVRSDSELSSNSATNINESITSSFSDISGSAAASISSANSSPNLSGDSTVKDGTLTMKSNTNKVSSSKPFSSMETPYTYFNSSVALMATSDTSNILSDSLNGSQTSINKSVSTSKSTTSSLCESGNSKDTSKQLARSITQRRVESSAVITPYLITHPNYVEVATSTYQTEVTSIISQINCVGDCSSSWVQTIQPETPSQPIFSNSTKLSKVSLAGQTQISENISSSTYNVQLNENTGAKSFSEIFKIIITLLSILTFF